VQKMSTKKKRPARKIYIVVYDQQEFLGYNTHVPAVAFSMKRDAELYAASRNFEFQTVCLQSEEEYANYVLENHYADFIISMCDFRDAYIFVREEMARSRKMGLEPCVWTIVSSIMPFKTIPIQHIKSLPKD